MTHDPERIRTAARALFADVYGEPSGPARRRVAYKHLADVPDDVQADVLANDLLRGGYAEAVLRAALGDTFDALLLHLRAGDVARVRRLLAETPLDGATVAQIVGQAARTVASTARLDVNNPGGGASVPRPPTTAGTSVADTVRTVFSTGDAAARAAGLRYLQDLASAEAVPPLAAIAEDANAPQADRVDALRLLGVLGHAAALPALRRVAREAGAAPVRGAALAAQVALMGTYDGVLTGPVAAWAALNPELALAVVGAFGDVADNDDFLIAILRGEGDDAAQMLAACALAMSANTDYVTGLVRFLGDDAARWARLLAVEAANPEPRITDLFAGRLRDLSFGMGANDDPAAILAVIAAVRRFDNDRARDALRRVAGNVRLPAGVRAAAGGG